MKRGRLRKVIVATTCFLVTFCFTAQLRKIQTNLEKVQNIVFLKTHKTGSCTLQNILMRYGETYNLTFALPAGGNKYQLGYPSKNVRNFVARLDQTKNIMCHHARFNHTSIKSFMPSLAKYVTILRHPVAVFESQFSFFSFGKSCMHMASNSMSKFLEKESLYSNITHCFGMATRNVQLYDLGLDEKDMDNATAVKSKIEEVIQVFDLVLIAEYFDESLVLLKELFSWETHDVVYFLHNVRASKSNLTASEKRQVLQRNRGDFNLYTTMLDILKDKIRNFGETKMRREVEKLRHMSNYWKDFCVGKTITGAQMNDPRMVNQKPFSAGSLGFQLKEDRIQTNICQQLTRAELRYTDHLFNLMKTK